jgi:hypothetical protein
MSRKTKKILLGIFIPILVLSTGIGITFLTINWPVVWSSDPPLIDLPLDSTNVEMIWGYGNHSGEFHNGIDFICNSSVDIIAWCKLRVTYITTFKNEGNGFWQTNVKFQYNWKTEFEAIFEPMTDNETQSTLQRDAIPLKFGQYIEPGEKIGTLLKFGNITLLHFGAKESGSDVCAYKFFNPSAKATFHNLWDMFGYGDPSWYTD